MGKKYLKKYKRSVPKGLTKRGYVYKVGKKGTLHYIGRLADGIIFHTKRIKHAKKLRI